MSEILENLKYTENHEWLKIEGDSALVGISDYAQESLGDITFVELPAVGDSFSQGDVFGTIESVKAASDLYMPVSGEIIAINESLDAEPEQVNSAPYGAGWIIRIQIADPAETEGLMGVDAYKEIST